jgi:hypothetical protein
MAHSVQFCVNSYANGLALFLDYLHQKPYPTTPRKCILHTHWPLFTTQRLTQHATQNGHWAEGGAFLRILSPTPYLFLSNCRSEGGAVEWREPYRGGRKCVESVPVVGQGGRAQRNQRRRRVGTTFEPGL